MSKQNSNLPRCCSVPGCLGTVEGRGLCNKHYLRMRNTGTTDLVPKPKRTAEEALMAGSARSENGCLEWFKTTRQGYGRVYMGGRLHSAHVLAWTSVNGEVPAGKQINHKCHNRACIDVRHLYVGDQVQNMLDMKLAGRSSIARGEQSGNSKLTDGEVIGIRASMQKPAALAREYRVCESTIRAIKGGLVWGWLEQPKE